MESSVQLPTQPDAGMDTRKCRAASDQSTLTRTMWAHLFTIRKTKSHFFTLKEGENWKVII